MILDFSTKGTGPAPCEARVEVKEGDGWVRLPITLCELWVNKDGPSNVQRTAKVKFPGEWGNRDMTQFINGMNAVQELPDEAENLTDADVAGFDEARVYFQDPDTGIYQIVHYGFVGGVGPAAEDGVFKFWIYDPADLMRRIRVAKSFGQPTIQQVIDFVLRGSDDNGRRVGLEHRSPFDDIGTYIAGIQEVRQQKRVEERQEEEVLEDVGQFFASVAEVDKAASGPFQLFVDDVVEDVFDFVKDNILDPLLTGQKRFQLNRHNMADLLNWFAAEIGGKWQFEPTESGPVLFFDNTSSRGARPTIFGAEQREDGELTRRRFIDEEVAFENVPAAGNLQSRLDEIQQLDIENDISDFQQRGAFDTVKTLNNEALYDIKPFNTLTLYGETHSPTEYANRDGAAGPSRGRPPGAPIMSARFPKVQVTYPPLVKRAGGYEYEAPAIESDKISLNQARQEAISEFRKYLEEETEGNIEIKGNPFITPYDYITTIAVCKGTYPNVNMPPMTYEVNSVKHTRSAGDHYRTRLGVSLVVDETLLDVEAEYIEA